MTEEIVQHRQYTLSYVHTNELAYEAQCRRWLSSTHEDSGYIRNQMVDLLKWNFDLIVPRDHVRTREEIIESKTQGKLTARERKMWHQMTYEWMSVVRKTVQVEECTPKHKQGIWLTYDDADYDYGA